MAQWNVEGRKKKWGRKKQQNVELNLAAMLDMAFQLLTFFILTFRPAPIEGQIDLRLPPPTPGVATATPPATDRTAANKTSPSPLTDLDTLAINVIPTPTGQIQSLSIDSSTFAGFDALDSRLKDILTNPDSLIRHVMIQAGSKLRYDELMRVIDVCSRQKMPDGSQLARLSFVELADTPP